MGAWASLEVDPARVYAAHRTAAFVTSDGEGGATFDARIDPAAPEAKQVVADEVLGRMGRFVTRYDSPEALLDALASEPKLAASVQSLLAYGLLHSEQFSGRNRGRDVFEQDADYFLSRIKAAAKALAETAPSVLGLTGRPPSSVGGSIASVYT